MKRHLLVLYVVCALTCMSSSAFAISSTVGQIKHRYLPPRTAATAALADSITTLMTSSYQSADPVRAMSGDLVSGTLVVFHNEDAPGQFVLRQDLTPAEGISRRLVAFGEATHPESFQFFIVEGPAAAFAGQDDMSGEISFRELSGFVATRHFVFENGSMTGSRESYDGMMTSYGGRSVQPSSVASWLANNILGAGTCTLAKWVAETKLQYRCPAWCTAWWNPWPSCALCLVSFCARSAS